VNATHNIYHCTTKVDDAMSVYWYIIPICIYKVALDLVINLMDCEAQNAGIAVVMTSICNEASR
jgi:hypothetical protein